MSSLRASAVVLGAVSLGLALMAAPTAAEPTQPVQPSAARWAATEQQPKADRASGRIAFRTRKGKVRVMDADGRHLRRLVDFGSSWSPTWSPDGRRIVFENYDGTGSQVWVVAADSGRARRLTDNAGSSGPSWSPDGRKIAYVSWTASNAREVFVMAADGSNQRPVTTSPAGVRAVTTAWSPSGSWIAFTTARYVNDDTSEWVLGLVRPDGTQVRRLDSSYGLNPTAPEWSPDGRAVAWSSDDGMRVFNLRSGRVLEVGGYGPLWSPDGRRIAFWCNGTCLMRSDGTKVRRLPFDEDSAPLAWSPNGRRLLVRLDVMTVVRLDGRVVRALREGNSPDWFGPAPTRTTVNAAPEPATKGKRLAVSGKVSKVGVGLYGATVKIRFKAAGVRRYTTVRTTTTDAMGRFKTKVTARRTGTWKAVHPATAATFTSYGTDRVKVRR